LPARDNRGIGKTLDDKRRVGRRVQRFDDDADNFDVQLLWPTRQDRIEAFLRVQRFRHRPAAQIDGDNAPRAGNHFDRALGEPKRVRTRAGAAPQMHCPRRKFCRRKARAANYLGQMRQTCAVEIHASAIGFPEAADEIIASSNVIAATPAPISGAEEG
jgi:hypothetical protein